MTNAMNYSDKILYNVRDVLYNVKQRGGLISNSFLQAEATRLQGQYAVIVINVACLAAIGKKKLGEDARFPFSDAQYNVLVEKAQQSNGSILADIAALRAEKGK
jgi:hypothetical protein